MVVSGVLVVRGVVTTTVVGVVTIGVVAVVTGAEVTLSSPPKPTRASILVPLNDKKKTGSNSDDDD